MDGEESEGRDGLAFWREDAIDRPLPPRILFRARNGGRRALGVRLLRSTFER